MELTLSYLIFEYLGKFILHLYFSFKNYPNCDRDRHQYRHPIPNNIIEESSISDLSVPSSSLKLSEVNAVMRRLGVMKDPCLDNNGNNWSNDFDPFYYEDDFVRLFEEVEPSVGEIKEVFEVFDGNKDGLIDGEDLQRVIWELGFREGFDLGRCKRMIQRFDGNGDGVIDFQEFLKFMEKCLC